MAITVGTLLVKLKADIAEFVSGMSKADQVNARTAASIKREIKSQTKEARDSVDLLSHSVGIALPRELKKVIASSELLRPALAGAFAVSGIVAFGAVIATEVLPKIKSVAEVLGGLTADVKEQYAQILKTNEKLAEAAKKRKEEMREILLIGKSETEQALIRLAIAREETSEKTKAIELGNKTLARMNAEADAEERKRAFSFGNPNLGFMRSWFQSDDTDAVKKRDKFREEFQLAKSALDDTEVAAKRAGAELKKAFSADTQEGIQQTINELTALANRSRELIGQGLDPLQRHIQDLNEQIRAVTVVEKELADANVRHAIITAQRIELTNELTRSINAQAEAVRKALAAENEKRVGQVLQMPSAIPGVSPSTANAAALDQLGKDTGARQQAQLEIWKSTRRAAEEYRLEVERLNIIFKDDRSSDLYKRGLEQLKEKYSEARIAARQFGEQVGNALQEVLIHGRSFKDFLKVLVVDVIQMIAKLTILKSLQESTSKGGVGGFFSSLLGGLFGFGGGKASGGSVQPGVAYDIHKDERVVLGSPGWVTPRSQVDNGQQSTIVYNISAGMSPQDEARWARVLREVHKDAQIQAVRRVREDALRR